MHFKNIVTIFCERYVAWFLRLQRLKYDAFVPFLMQKALKMEGNCDCCSWLLLVAQLVNA